MHDIHIHTQLSSCARPDATYQAYSKAAIERKLSVVGFTDHLWDHAIPGWSNWYSPMDIEHILLLQDEIKRNPIGNIRVYFGCETEYIGNNIVTLHRDNSDLFDFVLVPPHHFHNPQVRDPQITEIDKLVNLFVERFMEVCNIDFAFGIAHPFVPLGVEEQAAEVLQALPEKSLRECFTAACQSNKSIEINADCLKKMQSLGVVELYKNIILIAKDCTCKFHLGSDSHSMEDFSQKNYDLAAEFACQCGIALPIDPLEKYVSDKK